MQITDESTDSLSLRAEDSKPVIAAERFDVDEVVRGDVTVLADVGDDGLEVLFLVRIECSIGEEVCIALGGLLPVDPYDGTDECGHYVATEHLAATDVGLVFFLGAEVSPADGLQLDDVGVGELFQGEEFLQDWKVTVGLEPIHHALAVGDGELRANGGSVIFYNVGDVEGKLFALLGEDELHQVAHFVTDELQAVQGDVLHVGRICHFIDEGQLGGHLRNGGFLLQGLCNLADLVLGLGAFDLFIDQRELDVEDQDVEAQRCVVGQMAYQNGCHFLFEVDGVNAGDVGPVFLLLELVHDFTGLADGDALEVEFLDLTPEDVFQLVVEALGELICLVCSVLQDSQFQENAANEVVEVENAEECFFASGLTIVYAQVAHLADIVRRHHHPVVGDELDKGCPRHQFIQACPLRQLDILELIEGLHQPLQCPAAVEGRNIVLATALRLGGLAIYAEVSKRLYFSQVVKITHRQLFVKVVVHPAVH